MDDYEANLKNAMDSMIKDKRLDFGEYISKALDQRSSGAIEQHVASYGSEEESPEVEDFEDDDESVEDFEEQDDDFEEDFEDDDESVEDED